MGFLESQRISLSNKWSKMYFRSVTTITIFLHMVDFSQTKKCIVNENKIEIEKQFAHIIWSANNPLDNVNGTLLVEELASCIFTCKTSPYR